MAVPETVERTVEELDHLADAIDDVSAAITKLQSGKLNDRALLLLLSDASGLSKTEVQAVLAGMRDLKFRFRRRNAKGEYV